MTTTNPEVQTPILYTYQLWAIRPDGTPVTNTTGQVYDPADRDETTPLPLWDESGTPIQELEIKDSPSLRFKLDRSGSVRVIIGGLVSTLTSFEAIEQRSTEAWTAAFDAQLQVSEFQPQVQDARAEAAEAKALAQQAAAPGPDQINAVLTAQQIPQRLPRDNRRAVGQGELLVNAADYGTVGDGVADDTAALQIALNATAANGTLQIPAGTYRLTAALQWPSKVTIVGNGLPTLKLPEAHLSALVLQPGHVKPTIRGVRFQGTMPANKVGRYGGQRGIDGLAATAAQPVYGLRVDDCVFDDIEGRCIEVKHPWGARIRGSEFTNYGYAGVALFSVQRGTITDCDFVGTNKTMQGATVSYAAFVSIYEPDAPVAEWGGAATPLSADFSFTNNTVTDQAWECFDTHLGQRISFVGNQFFNCLGNAIAAVGSDPSSPLACRDITVANNTIVGPTTHGTARMGIVLRGAGSTVTGAQRVTGTVTGNTVVRTGDQDANVSGGIHLANALGVVVANNVIVEPRAGGVIAQDSIGTVCQGNTVRDVWKATGTPMAFGATILADAASDLTLIGNRLLRGGLTAGTGAIPAGALINTTGYHGTNTSAVTVYQAGNFWPQGTANGSQMVAMNAPGVQSQREAQGTAPPTSGTWATLDRMRNVAPTSGAPIGWVCISGGTPGNWKAYGTVS